MELNREKMNFISWYDDIEEKEMINQFRKELVSFL
jgi:hypothetical protein